MDSPFISESASDEFQYDEELAIEAQRALAYLQTTRNYRYVDFIAQGGYGWVSLVYDDEKKRSLAIKCSNDTSEMELSWWPKLEHPNILPLLEYIILDTCTVFIMPAMRKDLWMVVNEPKFYAQELSFGLCRIWLGDLANALCYLHGQFLCHLDLKLDNAFLKEDGFACLGDFSLLSDIREVPTDFHFLEIYEPPEYAEWCHGTAPDSISRSSRFGGDRADLWQYGILALDLLTNLRLTGARESPILFHHDVWPLLQKIALHAEYLDYLLEDTFCAVPFAREDLDMCHEFLTRILRIEPETRMTASEARSHPFLDVEWPQLPREFTLPKRVEEYLFEPLPLPKEEPGDSSLTVDEAASKEKDKEVLPEASSKGALDVMKRKMKRMQKEKLERRETILVEAGKKLLEIKAAPSGQLRKATPWSKRETGPEEDPDEDEDDDDSDNEDESSEDNSNVVDVKVTHPVLKMPSGKEKTIKVTAVRKTSKSKRAKKAKGKN